MKINRLLFLSIVGLAACSSPPPAETPAQIAQPVVMADTNHPKTVETASVNEEPQSQSTLTLSAFDGTIDNAKNRVKEICAAVDAKKVSCYTYLYNNGSGEETINCLKYFTYDPTPGHDDKHQDWFLLMQGKEKYMEYFFDENKKLFAVVHFSIGKDAELLAEIFYNKDGSIIQGSWLQKSHTEKIDLANYKGDYWYEFFEGYPYYPTTEKMEKDKSLKYQQ